MTDLRFPQRDETFRVDTGVLIRAVTPARGDPYEHRCSREVFVAVCHAIDELNGAPFTYESLRDTLGAPASQVAAAVAFLRERCCIVAAHGRKQRAAEDVYLGGMTELLALEAGA